MRPMSSYPNPKVTLARCVLSSCIHNQQTLTGKGCNVKLKNKKLLQNHFCSLPSAAVGRPSRISRCLRSHQFTQIQGFPANSAQRCNFNTSPQLSRKFDKSLSSPTTFSLPLHVGGKFCPVDTVQRLAEF